LVSSIAYLMEQVMGLLLLPLLLILMLSGCASVPDSLRADGLSTVTPTMVRDGAGIGEKVRWGGSVLEVRPVATETCITILSRPLDVASRPLISDANYGRFLACGSGFYDPAVFAKDRSVTVLGKVEGVFDGNVDGASYRFPKLQIQSVYLWPIVVYGPPYYGPVWGAPVWYGPGWGPYWYGPGWGPGWFGPGPYWGW
jgi:outer membrane lipoprotein